MATTAATIAAVGFLAGAAVSVLLPSTTSNTNDTASNDEEQQHRATKRQKRSHDEAVAASAEDAETESKCIYLDYNGTTPVYPRVVEAMLPFLEVHFGNPSSSHAFSRLPRAAVNQARKQILQLLEAPDTDYDTPESIVFASCGTESDNLAILLALRVAEEEDPRFHNRKGRKKKLPHVVTSNVEHPAVEACLKRLEEQGRCTVTYVPVGTDGRVLADDVADAIHQNSNTVLVTLMLANNETGALQPVAEVSWYCHSSKVKNNVLFHTDASQAAGKVSVGLDNLGSPDLVTLAGHKLGAPKGVACLYVRPGCLGGDYDDDEDDDDDDGPGMILAAGHGITTVGAGQEFGLRAGTENVASIVGFGCAAAYVATTWKDNAQRMEGLRDRLLRNLQTELGPDSVRPNGPAQASLRLPNTLSVGIRDVHSGNLLKAVGDRVAASAGATCHSSSDCGISATLRNMQVPSEWARGTLRLSIGPATTADEVDRASTILAAEAKRQLEEKVEAE